MRHKRLTFLAVVIICGTAISALSADPPTVKVGFLPATHDALLFIAKEMNLFDSSRISVQLKAYDNSVQILSDLKSGIIDIGIPGVATPAAEIGGRAPLSIVGGAAAESAALVVQSDLLSGMVHKNTVEQKIKLLTGKKVGAVRGSTGLAVFRQALSRAGLNEKSLDLRTYSKPADIISALVTKDLDAGLLWSPHMTLAENKGFKIGIWMSEVLPHHVCCRQVARDAFIQENYQAIVEYLAGLLRAQKKLVLARKAPIGSPQRDQVFAAVQSYLPTLNAREINLELFASNPRTTISPDIDREGIRRYLEAMQIAGLMRKDQCANVEEKIRTDIMAKAYERIGCSPSVAKGCITKPSSACECMQ